MQYVTFVVYKSVTLLYLILRRHW